MRSGAASRAPASSTARLAAATASWLTRSTPGSCSLVNQRDSSNATVAAAAGRASSGNTACTAESPRISASNSRSGSSPCGEITPMPVTATTVRVPGAQAPEAVSGHLLGAQPVDQLGQAGQRLDALVLVGQREVEPILDLEQEFGHGQRIEALLAHRQVRIERGGLDVVLLADDVL